MKIKHLYFMNAFDIIKEQIDLIQYKFSNNITIDPFDNLLFDSLVDYIKKYNKLCEKKIKTVKSFNKNKD